MGDLKSKLPDFKELASMTNTLFRGIKNSVHEIIQDYKQKRAEEKIKDVEEVNVTKSSEKVKTETITPEGEPVVTPKVKKKSVTKEK